MKHNRSATLMIVSTVLIALLFVGPTSSSAQDTNWYLGAGYGISSFDSDVTNLTGGASLDDEDSGFKFFAGYQFNDFLGIEIGYADLGETELKGNTGDSFVMDGVTYSFLADGVTVTADVYVIPIFAVFSLPLDRVLKNDALKYITPFAKVGAYYWESEAEATANGLSTVKADEDDTDIAFGAGLNLNFTKNIAIRAEWERFNQDEDIDFFSGSFIVKF